MSRTAASPLRAIRAKCMDCCCGQAKEIRFCAAAKCPLYDFRFGHRPKGDTNDEMKEEVGDEPENHAGRNAEDI